MVSIAPNVQAEKGFQITAFTLCDPQTGDTVFDTVAQHWGETYDRV